MQTKSVIVIAADLSAGFAANASAVLGVILGQKVEQLIGPDATDADGVVHPGVIAAPVPILRHTPDGMSDLAERATADETLFIARFSSLAQRCRTYDEYIDKMLATSTADLDLVGIALHGPRKHVDRLVGALPLLR